MKQIIVALALFIGAANAAIAVKDADLFATGVGFFCILCGVSWMMLVPTKAGGK